MKNETRDRLRHGTIGKILVGCLALIAPLAISAGIASSHSLPDNSSGHVTNYNLYRIGDTIPSTWHSDLNWAGDTWDGVPSQTHQPFANWQNAGYEWVIVRDGIDGLQGVVASMTVSHVGAVEIMRFDPVEPWHIGITMPAPGTLDLRSIAVHEFGHTLYLPHSTVAGDVMNKFTVGYAQARRILTGNDQTRFQVLY